jgi:hypothetical protein
MEVLASSFTIAKAHRLKCVFIHASWIMCSGPANADKHYAAVRLTRSEACLRSVPGYEACGMTRRFFVLQIAAPLSPLHPNRRNIAWDDFLEVVNRNTITIDWLHKYLKAHEEELTLRTVDAQFLRTVDRCAVEIHELAKKLKAFRDVVAR